MAHVDYMGPIGGELAVAFAGGFITALGGALALWKMLFEPRLKHADEQLALEKSDCAVRIGKLEQRIAQLEGVLFNFGPKPLRDALQAQRDERHED